MKHEKTTRRAIGSTAAILGLAVAGFGLGAFANAGCSSAAQSKARHESAGFLPAVYRPGEDTAARFIRVSEDADDNASIVGLWRFEVRVDAATVSRNRLPTDLFDWGLATWHDDGTEIQFSAARPPSAGDVCMGVWRKVGPNKYYLNHLAFGLSPPQLGASGTLVGPASIQMTVTVDPSGNSYTGRFKLTQYVASPSGVPFSEFDENTLGPYFTGTVSAMRVTTNN